MYFVCLIASLLVHVCAILLAPVLPLLAVRRYGYSDNGKSQSTELRLPLWLSWFDTPDNSLRGDARWDREHTFGYLSMVGWLLRNRAYGFNWTVLSRAIQSERTVTGDPDIGYQGSQFGTLKIKQPNGAWQYKVVRPLFGKVFEGNFGWLLDDTSKQRALFMLSPRLK